MSSLSLEIYGFKKPYDASVVLFVLMGLALFFFTLVALVATYLLTDGVVSLSFENSRFLYFCYVGALGILTALLAPYKKLAFITFVVGMFELGLGLGLATVDHFGFRINHLFPAPSGSARFAYHPLLVGIPKHNFSKIENAGRIRFVHNEYGQRAVESSSDNGAYRVAVFGGSTTYDVGVSNPNTWVEVLASELGQAFEVRNNGVLGYGTVEHLIQTAFYVDRGFDYVPNCALYYVGWNDIRNIGLGNNDKGFADYHLLSQFANLQITTGAGIFSPLAILSKRILASQIIPHVEKYDPSDVETLDDDYILNSNTFEISFSNLKSIIALNEQRGISTILVPQILNASGLDSDVSSGWLPRIADKDVMRILGRYNEKLEVLASNTSALFMPIAQSKFVSSDFFDDGHFSERGAKKFASLLVDGVRRSCSFQK